MSKLPRDTIYHYEYDGKGNINIKITDLIRCKDCKHYAPEAGDDSYALGYCPFIGSHLVMSKGFCAWGERRGEEDDSN